MKLKKSFAIHSLGCKVNQYEGEYIREKFLEAGFIQVDFSQKADLYIINTCTVTKKSNKESRNLIRKAKINNPHSRVVVTGCYVDHLPEELINMKEVDLLLNNEAKYKILDLYNSLKEKRVFTLAKGKDYPLSSIYDFHQRSRAFVKIQDGCNNSCSFCIVPYVRGRSRSRDVEDILSEVSILSKKGFKEIVLTGINLGQFGKEKNPKITLSQLIEEIAENPMVERVRLSSINLPDINNDLIKLVALHPKVCKHLHIPLQSGSDYILRLMKRNYTSKEYREMVDHLRKEIPDIGITTDILVGFPKEEEEHFMESYSLVKDIRFSRAHIFKYSPRPNTPAYYLSNHILEEIKNSRSCKLKKLEEENRRLFSKKYFNKKLKVLVEEYKESKRLYFGYSSNYLRIGISSNEDIRGKLLEVKIINQNKDYLVATIL
jgi:threonylcarbamoyladenosine tRNA methylthiotransferase MtaB